MHVKNSLRKTKRIKNATIQKNYDREIIKNRMFNSKKAFLGDMQTKLTAILIAIMGALVIMIGLSILFPIFIGKGADIVNNPDTHRDLVRFENGTAEFLNITAGEKSKSKFLGSTDVGAIVGIVMIVLGLLPLLIIGFIVVRTKYMAK